MSLPSSRYLGASSMRTWAFSKALHLQATNHWARFISMQHNYNLLAREEEREMIPLCAEEGVQTMIYSPLARGKLARPWGQTTARSESEPAGAKQNQVTADSDRAIIEAVREIAAERVVSQAEIASAWLGHCPVVVAQLVGALKPKHIDDAVAALSITLTDDEVARLTTPYTPRVDGQGNSDPAVLHRGMEATTGFKVSTLA